MYKLTKNANAGGTDENEFRKQFVSAPKISVGCEDDVKNQLESSRVVLENVDNDWSKRNTALKAIRGVILNGGQDYEDQLVKSLNNLTTALEISIKDLRSQVCREACITVSYAIDVLGAKVSTLAIGAFLVAFPLVSSSTKIMATSAATMMAFIVKNIHHKDILATVASQASSKSAATRKHVALLLVLILSEWDDATIRRNAKTLMTLTKGAINDADPTARANGRETYQKMELRFPDLAKLIFSSLDAQRQKYLSGMGSRPGSTTSLADVKGTAPTTNLRPASKFLADRSATESQIKRHMPSKLVAKTPVPTTRQVFAKPTLSMKPSAPATRIGQPAKPTSSLTSSRQPSFTSNRQPSFTSTRQKSFTSTRQHSLTAMRAGRMTPSPMTMSTMQPRQVTDTDDDDFLLPKAPVMPLPQVLAKCSSLSPNDKKEGVIQLQKHVEEILSEADVVQIGDKIVVLLADCGSPALLPSVFRVTETLIKNHHKYLTARFVGNSVAKLTFRHGSELVTSTKEQIDKTLRLYLSTFDSEMQLHVLSNFLTNPVTNQGPKAKAVMLRQLKELLESHTENGIMFNTPDVIAMVKKLFQFMEDERNRSIFIEYCEDIITALFSRNAACLMNILSTFTVSYRDLTYKILQKHGKAAEEYSRSSTPATAAVIQDSVEENVPATSSHQAPEPSRTPLKKVSIDQNTLSPISPMKWDDNLTKELEGMKISRNIQSNGSKSSFIKQQLDIMERCATEPEDANRAVHDLLAMMCDGTFTEWELFFHKMLLANFRLLESNDSTLNKCAVRVLNKMCIAQASRLFDSTEMAICKVMDAVVDKSNSSLIIAAEDCLKTLATHLPIQKVISCAKANINKQDVEDIRITLTLKMLTRLFECAEEDELEMVVGSIVDTIIGCYESRCTSVRKCAVFCLVALVSRLGQERMQPFLKTLSATSANLIQVYVSKTKAKANIPSTLA